MVGSAACAQHQGASASSAMLLVSEPAALKLSAAEVVVPVSKGGVPVPCIRVQTCKECLLTASVPALSLRGVPPHPHR